MFTHASLVRLKDPAIAETVAEIIRPLGALCTGVAKWEVGVNLLPNAEFHVCMLGVFVDDAAYAAYNENPAHHEVSAKVRPYIERAVPFDYVS